ncbi:DUF6236 family protein [Streptodolium elevatio]|uniref:DUF6236 family protein n=1 Tax=Streptodolium elevatio TaxID=3157996 RepID=A0ABV3DQ04_9ACTN
MPSLLYYPSIVPPPEVVHQAVLYWDGFGSVVPDTSDLRQAGVADDLVELEAHGLYQPLQLAAEVFDEYSPSAAVLVDELRRLASAGSPSPPDSFIYVGKLGAWLEDELVALGFATPGRSARSGGPRLQVGKDVETLVLGVVARELAQYWSDRERPYFPYTTSDDAYRRSLRPSPDGTVVPAWQMEIGKLLPVPASNTPLSEVLKFRERYADERGRLMRALHRLLDELRRCWEHPSDVLAQFQDELAQASRDYQAAQRSRFRTVASEGITWTGGIAAGSAGVVMGLPAEIVAPAVGGLTAIWLRARAAKDAGTPATDDFSYLHQVRKTLG